MKGYARHVRRILLVVLALNAAVAAAKLYAGWKANSLSVLGDGLHSSVDALANVVALLVLAYSTRPADEDHPFGHAKFETLAAFALSGLMLLTAFELGQQAIARLLAPEATQVTSLTMVVMGVTLAVNAAVAWAETRAGREAGSDLLLADASQTRMDILVTISVLGGLGLQRLGWAQADAVLALAVAGFIGYAAYAVVRELLPVLTDRIVHDPAEVARVVMSVPGVASVHDIRSRGHKRESYVQMHLVVEPRDVEGAHAVTDEVERRVSEALGVKEVFVHVEPEDDRSGPPGTSGTVS